MVQGILTGLTTFKRSESVDSIAIFGAYSIFQSAFKRDSSHSSGSCNSVSSFIISAHRENNLQVVNLTDIFNVELIDEELTNEAEIAI